MRASLWTKSEGTVLKVGFPYRFQYDLCSHLDDAITHRGYTQRSHLAISFGYFVSSDRLRTICLIAETQPTFLNETVFSVIIHNVSDRLPVYACTSTVGFDPYPCHLH